MIHQSKARHSSGRSDDRAWRHDRICPYAAPVSNKSPELQYFRLDDFAVQAYSEARIGELISVVRDDRSGLKIYVATEDAVADEVEVSKLGSGKQDACLQFSPGSDHTVIAKTTAAPDQATGGDHAAWSDYQRTFHDGIVIDLGVR